MVANSAPPAIIDVGVAVLDHAHRQADVEWVAVVQAVTAAKFGPLMPVMIESCPEIMLMIVLGT